MLDELWRVMRDQTILAGVGRFDVATSGLPSGIYIGRLITSSGNEEAKIIVRH